MDGCNRPPELIADGEKWTRMSSKDIEAVKNQRKLSQFFGSKSESDPLDRSDRRRCRPKKVEAVIEGDGCVPSISAASIIAKVHRDRLMERIDKDYPLYGFNKHKASNAPNAPAGAPTVTNAFVYIRFICGVYIYTHIYILHINNILYKILYTYIIYYTLYIICFLIGQGWKISRISTSLVR